MGRTSAVGSEVDFFGGEIGHIRTILVSVVAETSAQNGGIAFKRERRRKIFKNRAVRLAGVFEPERPFGHAVSGIEGQDQRRTETVRFFVNKC